MNAHTRKQDTGLEIKLSRKRYLQVVRQALEVEEYRFARQAILEWLATFPGDLEAGLYYAQALLGAGHIQEAIPVLSGLCIADPEFEEAAITWYDAEMRLRSGPVFRAKQYQAKQPAGAVGDPIPAHLSLTMRSLRSYVYALSEEQDEPQSLASWGEDLKKTRQALKRGDLALAEEHIRRALKAEPPLPLAAVMHLHYLAQSKAPMEARLELAKRYQRIWPDCLSTNLYLAHWSMETDQSTSVALLHQAAARDVGAQVAGRLWKKDNPYQGLWPSNLELPLKFAMPAKVASMLGWNQLAANARITGIPSSNEVPQEENLPIQSGERPSQNMNAWSPVVESEPSEAAAHAPEKDLKLSSESHSEAPGDSQDSEGTAPQSRSEEREALRLELEKIAKQYDMEGITRLDGRFPVYVVFSTRSGLQATYGRRAATILEKEMTQLVDTIQQSPGWGARLFLADDPSKTTQLGIRPAKANDPWALKLALADLDTALASRGEMIGALLIVGDPEVVPFHHLPNPLDDEDDDIPSDNPYATRDKNYFIPEWPIGRLPSGGDPKLLLQLLQDIRKVHAARLKKMPWYRKFLQMFLDLFKSGEAGPRESFGYTAAIWREAAGAVFRPIGNPRGLQISPPRGVFEGTFLNPVDPVLSQDGLKGGVPLPLGRFGYFNLHGLVDAAEWFGQRDPLTETASPDYPIAIRPQDIEDASNGNGSGVPRVVFSEACYGLHIQGKKTNEAIALKFLEAGSQAVAGSTCMAYGSIEKPLIAADLLGHEFWRCIQDGLPAGEALRQAKIALADEMDRRQGYLDGEDQKTLISFILYGDPLAQESNGSVQPKGVLRLATPLPEVKTICERAIKVSGGAKAPADVLTSVNEVVSRYLPGMSDAEVAVAFPRTGCSGEGHCCPSSQLSGNGNAQCKSSVKLEHEYRLVTLSKVVPRLEGVHKHYARITLGEGGEILKLVVSR